MTRRLSLEPLRWASLLICLLIGAATADHSTAPDSTSVPVPPEAVSIWNVPLNNIEQLRPFSGKPLEIKRAVCQAAGKPDAAAAMFLEVTGPYTYQIVRLEYNDQGKEMLQKGKEAPQIQKYYQKYITQQQPTNRVIFETLLGAWKLFGLKFDWDKATYHCQLASARGRVSQ